MQKRHPGFREDSMIVVRITGNVLRPLAEMGIIEGEQVWRKIMN